MQVLLVLGGGSSWFRGSLDIQSGVDRLVLAQGPSTLVRIATYLSFALLLLGAWLCYRAFFVSTTTTFACERASGRCTLDGEASDMPALADVVGAKLTSFHRSRQGEFKMVTLELKDGGTKDLSAIGAQRTEAVGEYKSAVDAIQKFLADPAAPRLETSFTYRSSTWEKMYSLATWTGMMMVCALLLGMSVTRTYTFDRSTGTAQLVDKRPLFGTSSREIPFAQIASVAPGELTLTDQSKVTIFTPPGGDEAKVILDKLHELTNKP